MDYEWSDSDIIQNPKEVHEETSSAHQNITQNSIILNRFAETETQFEESLSLLNKPTIRVVLSDINKKNINSGPDDRDEDFLDNG